MGFVLNRIFVVFLLNTEMFASKAKIVKMLQKGYQILQYFASMCLFSLESHTVSFKKADYRSEISQDT